MRLSPSDPKALFQLAVSSYSQSAGKELLHCREKHILLGRDSPHVLIKPPGRGKWRKQESDLLESFQISCALHMRLLSSSCRLGSRLRPQSTCSASRNATWDGRRARLRWSPCPGRARPLPLIWKPSDSSFLSFLPWWLFKPTARKKKWLGRGQSRVLKLMRWKHRALQRTRLVNGYSKWILKFNSPLLNINTSSVLLFLGYFHEPQWNHQTAVPFSFTYWWIPFGIIMYLTRPQRSWRKYLNLNCVSFIYS